MTDHENLSAEELAAFELMGTSPIDNGQLTIDSRDGGREGDPSDGAEQVNTGAKDAEQLADAPDGNNDVGGVSSASPPNSELRIENEELGRGDAGSDAKRGEQTVEERAAHAGARREGRGELHAQINAATEAARREAFARAEAEYDARVKAMNLVDPDTGAKVESFKEFVAFREKLDSRELSERLALGEVTAEDVQALVESKVRERLANHEDVLAARNALSTLMAAQEQARKAAFEARLENELKEVSGYDPSVKTLKDVFALDRAQTLNGYLDKGLTLPEAYKLTYADKVAAALAAAQPKKKAGGVGHLASAKPAGAGPGTLAGAELEAFRLMNPYASDAELEKLYATVAG